MRANDFRGTGWAFPILPGPDGALHYVSDDDNVAQSMYLLLKTMAGERATRPTFGTTVAESLFHGDSEHVLRQVEQAIADAVREWEPRVELENVAATRDQHDDTAIEVLVSYRVLRTNTKRNLVFPYYAAAASGPT